MPVIVTQQRELRHVLATVGGQGQPQILTQVFLRMLEGVSATDAAAVESLLASNFDLVEMPRHSETLGQANVVRMDSDGQPVAAADHRADGSAVVAKYALHRRGR